MDRMRGLPPSGGSSSRAAEQATSWLPNLMVAEPPTSWPRISLVRVPACNRRHVRRAGSRTTSWPPDLMASPKSLRGFCVTWSCFVVIPATDARDRVFMESMTC